MPILEIASSTEDRREIIMGGPRVLATMLYPSDEFQRKHCVELFGAFEDLQEESSREAVWISLQQSLISSEKQIRSGIIAGHILCLVRQMHIHHPTVEASVGKASYIISEVCTILGKPVKRSTIMKAWGEFKPVSHLWAAGWVLANAPQPNYDGVLMNSLFLTIINHFKCRKMVSVAEDWRRFGENHQNRQDSCTLDHNETWAAPRGYEVTSPSELFPAGGSVPTIPNLSAAELDALGGYKAPAPY